MNPDLAIHHLWFTTEALTDIWLPQEKGPAIRGAVVSSLRQHYCPDASIRPAGDYTPTDAAHRANCPVCWLIALEDATSERGRDVPRPYTIEPPLTPGGRTEKGQSLSFGISLVGQAVNLFPYLALAVPELGRQGIGSFDPRQGSRGRFVVRSVSALNPLTGATQKLLTSGTTMRLPAVPVEGQQVQRIAVELAQRARLNDNSLAIDFHTPTRIVAESHLVHRPAFGPLFQRLLERVGSLSHYYANDELDDVVEPSRELIALANEVRVADDQTQWVELKSGSRRLGRATPVSGYQGKVTLQAPDWSPLSPLAPLGAESPRRKERGQG